MARPAASGGMTLPTDRSLRRLAAQVGRSLQAEGASVTTAESCTGGWIAKCLTDVPGSSAWFQTGYVSYANRAKTALLGVPAPLLARHGAVSEPVVRRMASGALRAAHATWAVSVSGIAGPDGGSVAKPVGTVWIGLAHRVGRRVVVESFLCAFRGDREAVRRRTVARALQVLLAR